MDKLIKATENNEELKRNVQTLFDKAVSKNMFFPENEIKARLLRLVDKIPVANSNNQQEKRLNQSQNQQNNRFQNNRNQNQYQNNRFRNNQNQNQQQYQPRQSFNRRPLYNNFSNNLNNQGEFRRQYIQNENQQQK